VQDVVDVPFHVDVARDVVADELEVAVAQVREVGHRAGAQVVDADDRVAAVEQRLAQMRPDEPGGAGDDDACHQSLPWCWSGLAAVA
jgi:hypothetical protein